MDCISAFKHSNKTNSTKKPQVKERDCKSTLAQPYKMDLNCLLQDAFNTNLNAEMLGICIQTGDKLKVKCGRILMRPPKADG